MRTSRHYPNPNYRLGSEAAAPLGESFVQRLKRERIRRRTQVTREAAMQDVFEYIRMFHNPKRRHRTNGMLSPVDFETSQQKLDQTGVRDTSGTSVFRSLPVRPQRLRLQVRRGEMC
jgi:hypothetical protein